MVIVRETPQAAGWRLYIDALLTRVLKMEIQYFGWGSQNHVWRQKYARKWIIKPLASNPSLHPCCQLVVWSVGHILNRTGTNISMLLLEHLFYTSQICNLTKTNLVWGRRSGLPEAGWHYWASGKDLCRAGYREKIEVGRFCAARGNFRTPNLISKAPQLIHRALLNCVGVFTKISSPF